MFLHANNEESDQTARMRRMTRIFVGRKYANVRFLKLKLECFRRFQVCSKVKFLLARQIV